MQEIMIIKEVEEVIEMKLFTFIAEYKGGTYISQYTAKTLDEALHLWINNVDFFTKKQLKSFKREFSDGDIDSAVELKGLDNTWCVCYTVLGDLLLLNIVETMQKNLKGPLQM